MEMLWFFEFLFNMRFYFSFFFFSWLVVLLQFATKLLNCPLICRFVLIFLPILIFTIDDVALHFHSASGWHQGILVHLQMETQPVLLNLWYHPQETTAKNPLLTWIQLPLDTVCSKPSLCRTDLSTNHDGLDTKRHLSVSLHRCCQTLWVPPASRPHNVSIRHELCCKKMGLIISFACWLLLYVYFVARSINNSSRIHGYPIIKLFNATSAH